jgi:transposase-like protein
MDIGGDPMTMTQAEMVTSVRQRRRWSRAEKERIVAAAMEPGAVASAVAREAGIQASPAVSLAPATASGLPR